MPDAIRGDLAARGAAWMEELGQQLEEDAASRRQLQRFMEELSARTEERLQRMEERVAQVEGSLLRALGSVMPKVEELLARYQSPTSSATIAAITSSPMTSQPPSKGVIAPSAPSCTTVIPASDKPRCQNPSTLSDRASQIPHTCPTSTAPTNQHQQVMASQSEVVADLQSSSNISPTSFTQAVELGDVTAVQRMLASGARLDKRNKHGNNALHVAAKHGHVLVLDFLISYGASVDPCGQKMRTPLHLAAIEGHLASVRCLVAAGANLECLDSDGNTAITLAAAGGHVEVLDFLVEKGAGVDTKDTKGQTPLHHAVSRGHLEAASILVAKGALVDSTDVNGETPLFCAAKNSCYNVVKFLLELGASPRMKNRTDDTPIIMSAKVGHTDCLDEMLKIVTPNQQEIMRCLCVTKSREVVWSLLERSRDFVVGDAGKVALVAAAKDGRLEVLEALLELGINPNTTDSNSKYSLHWAVEKGHSYCVRALLRAGAYPNSAFNFRLTAAEDFRLYTALHVAVTFRKMDCIRELLKAGADRNIKDNFGKTPLHRAKEMKWAECERLLS